MNKSKGSLLFGIIILLLGVIFLGNTLGIWSISIFFKGWWTLLIIIPTFVGMIKEKTYISSFLVIAIAMLMLCACQSIIEWNMVGKLFIPLFLITIGLTIIFKPKQKNIKRSYDNKEDYIGVFSEVNEKVLEKIKDTSIVSVFGKVSLDLKEAKISDDITIECVSVFGGIVLLLPDNVNVKTSGVPIFGGINNNIIKNKKENKITINIEYVSIFSGIDIK